MENDTSLVIEATRKASRFLQRDYFELENLQSSEKSRVSFCQKACGKAMQILHENLSKYFSTIIFSNQDAEKMTSTGKIVLVETLDGLENFTRSMPFFAIMVTIITNKNGEITAEKSVINFPALGEIYYAEKGRGAWLERHSSNLAGGAVRLRMSGNTELSSALVAVNNDNLTIAQKILNLNSSNNIRIFESYTYSLAMLISGKIDIFISSARAISSFGVELFIRESSGKSSMKNGNLIFGSNFKLHDKIDLLK